MSDVPGIPSFSINTTPLLMTIQLFLALSHFPFLFLRENETSFRNIKISFKELVSL